MSRAKLSPSELRDHEHAHGMASLAGDKSARISYLWDRIGPGQFRARDPHYVLPIREVEGDRYTAGAHMSMMVRPDRIRTQEERELYAFSWYLAVCRENGKQGVRTLGHVLFRKQLPDGAAVLAYLREKLGVKRGAEFSPFEVVPRTELSGEEVWTLERPTRGTAQSPADRLAAVGDMVCLLQLVQGRIPRTPWLREALTEAIRLVAEEPALGLDDIAHELWPDDEKKRKQALETIRRHARPILKEMKLG